MTLPLVLIVCILSVFFLLLRVYWERIPTSYLENRTQGVTVIVPVRNEENTIQKLLEAVDMQDFPMHLLEVLVIDDHSEDGTVQKVRKAAMHTQYSLKCIALSNEQRGKKLASTIGNDKAKYDLILCTDADSCPQKNWISLMTGPLMSKNYQMVSGPVKMTGTTIIERLQALEFSGLIGFGAVSLYLRMPTMCNGANMAYQKKAFKEVEGYMDNLHIPSGDDEFLLRKIAGRYPDQVTFVKSPKAKVTTAAIKSPVKLWGQRVRWISKWRFHRSSAINTLAVLSFLVFSGMAVFLLVLLFLKPLTLFISWTIMLTSTSTYLFQTSRFVNLSQRPLDYLLLVLIYPYYAVVLGLASIFGSYTWKGRTYK